MGGQDKAENMGGLITLNTHLKSHMIYEYIIFIYHIYKFTIELPYNR